ncbi:flagellar type III secretion system pore protein FliP [Alkalispirochaeta alkalica]|uniref:flagellar type III secretion system pore protein FliP n=1 Tax=Alkalispirochaeta alkalica TaxID=46356 RepID=UPI00036F11F1|nr:flagellar type III secretion system pore protein FliP [Alkalispirochaeta alkalica]
MKRPPLFALAGFVLFLLAPLSPAPEAQSVRDRDVNTLGDPLLAPAPGETGLQIPFLDMQLRGPDGGAEVAFSLQLLLMLAVLSLAPSIIIIMTCFLRIAIVLDFVKRALSLQQVPPTQVLMGIALFMTVFIMMPTLQEIYDTAYVPLREGEIGLDTAYSRFEGPLRIFMFRQMERDTRSVELFMRMADLDRPETLADVPTHVLIPAFVLNELTVAFKIGILLFIPFIVVDMVVASVLMSMGMIMLPPVMISMPFKLILFVLVDGWNLIIQQLVAGFGGFL